MKILDKQGLQNLPIELQGITAHKIASYEEKLAALDAAPPNTPILSPHSTLFSAPVILLQTAVFVLQN